MSNFVETFFEVLKEHEMSIPKFAKKIGISDRVLRNMRRYNPTVQTALKIVDYFSSSMDYFMGISDVFLCKVDLNYKVDLYGNMMKELKFQKISRKKASTDTGIGESTFDRWKKGVLPTLDNLEIIAKYLGMSVDKLLGRNYETKQAEDIN